LFVHNTKVVGYLTLAMSKLSKNFHKDFGTMTTQNVPALLIGGMARHVEYKGRGVGILMRDYAINKAFKLSDQIGCRLLALESVQDKIDLYAKWGFSPIESEYRNTMFIDLLKIKNEL
jgi:predicted GNAT family N-acyltransferase